MFQFKNVGPVKNKYRINGYGPRYRTTGFRSVEQAQKTIEKKDQKLKEINNILKEKINPTVPTLTNRPS